MAAGADTEQQLGDGLTLRSMRNEADVRGFIDLNATVTNEGSIAARLVTHHPETHYNDFLLVVDERTGQIVSTTCLIPWQCDYDGVILNVAMLEMVVTHPAYRHRGLVRVQVERFHHLVAQRRFDLCLIQGIPYYYRQYGYAYALDHTPLTVLPGWGVPDEPAGASAPYRLRPAGLPDVARLTQLYQAAMVQNQVSVQRSGDYWRYLLQHLAYPVQIVEAVADAQIVGYVTVERRGEHRRVQENSLTGREIGLAVLQQLKDETGGEIQIMGPETNNLARLAHSLGGVTRLADQWLWRIPDVGALLTRLAPVLQRRLAQAEGPAQTVELVINLYRQAYRLKLAADSLAVEPLGFVDTSMGAAGGDWCIPPAAFIRLLLGYRRLDDLRDAWPDIRIKPASRYWLDILFPQLRSHLLLPY